MSDKLDFADLKFKIECGRMVLTQGANIPRVVSGPGEIWQDAEGVLQFKIFTDQSGYRALQSYASRSGVVGQLIPDDEFFALQAEEYNLPVWTALRIIPSYRGGCEYGLAHGYLQELVHTVAIPQNREHDFVQLRIKGKLKFPCNQMTRTETSVGGQVRNMAGNLNVAIIKDCDFQFELKHEREHTVVSLRLPAGQLTDATPMRIQEAFQFVMGQQLSVMVIETFFNGRHITRLISPGRGSGKIPQPLHLSPTDLGNDYWQMFINYFRHVQLNTNPLWHPISCHVASVIESSVASLEVEILSLAVAVEGLVRECFSNLAPVDPKLLAELNAVEIALSSVKLAVSTQKRLAGTISQMRNSRNSDLLHAFITANRLPIGLFKSWNALRNTSAHGGGNGRREIQRTLQLRCEVLSLLYSIVFAAINYAGLRTDYSIKGWPKAAWPIPQQYAAPSAPAIGKPQQLSPTP